MLPHHEILQKFIIVLFNGGFSLFSSTVCTVRVREVVHGSPTSEKSRGQGFFPNLMFCVSCGLCCGVVIGLFIKSELTENQKLNG